jgi:site-specific recombinase XerD
MILGKGARFRQIKIEALTAETLALYISRYRPKPKPLHRQRLFINQRGTQLTRHGVYRICKKYLNISLTAKRLEDLNPVHSFRHACAVRMLASGSSITEIKNRLGHENIESTMIYLKLDLSALRRIQKKFMDYAEPVLRNNPQIDELIDWENRKDIMTWLDSL